MGASDLPPLLPGRQSAGSGPRRRVRRTAVSPAHRSERRRYVGMDVVQNSTGSVEIVSTLEQAVPNRGFSVILCTEVLRARRRHRRGVCRPAPADPRRWRRRADRPVHVSPAHGTVRFPSIDAARDTAAGRQIMAFRSNRATPLGALPHVVATLVADASILPASRSLYSKVKVGALRAATAGLVRLLDSEMLSRSVVHQLELLFEQRRRAEGCMKAAFRRARRNVGAIRRRVFEPPEKAAWRRAWHRGGGRRRGSRRADPDDGLNLRYSDLLSVLPAVAGHLRQADARLRRAPARRRGSSIAAPMSAWRACSSTACIRRRASPRSKPIRRCSRCSTPTCKPTAPPRSRPGTRRCGRRPAR